MNVSIRNEIIWLAPERTATSITKKIFEKYDFFSITKKNNYKLVNLKHSKQSHETIHPELYSDFKIVSNIRNPYDRIFGCYNKYYLEKPLMKKTPNVKNNFNKWVRKVFWNHGFNIFLSPFFSSDEENHFNKWVFKDISPDYVVRVENLYEDIMKLPFIDKESSETIKKLIENNNFFNKRYFVFDDMYEIETAKLIYNYYKPVFFRFGYSPFSFTKTELTNSEKISFIHGSID